MMSLAGNYPLQKYRATVSKYSLHDVKIPTWRVHHCFALPRRSTLPLKFIVSTPSPVCGLVSHKLRQSARTISISRPSDEWATEEKVNNQPLNGCLVIDLWSGHHWVLMNDRLLMPTLIWALESTCSIPPENWWIILYRLRISSTKIWGLFLFLECLKYYRIPSTSDIKFKLFVRLKIWLSFWKALVDTIENALINQRSITYA